MTNAAAKYGLMPNREQTELVFRIANEIAKAIGKGMGPLGGKAKTAQEIAVRGFVALEKGIPLMHGMLALDVEKGEVGMPAQMKVGLVRQRGIADLDIVSYNNEGATVRIHRHDWAPDRWEEVSFTKEDATRAGLMGKETYRKYPAAMFVHRAYVTATNLYCQDATLGVGYSYDELGYRDADGDVIDIAADEKLGLDTPVRPGIDTVAPPPKDGPEAGPLDTTCAAEPPAAPEPEPPAAEMTTQQKVSAGLKALGYGLADWRKRLAVMGVGSLSDAGLAAQMDCLKLLRTLYDIRILRDGCRLSDSVWDAMKAKRKIESDLELTVEDAAGIRQALYEKKASATVRREVDKLVMLPWNFIDPPPKSAAEQ